MNKNFTLIVLLIIFNFSYQQVCSDNEFVGPFSEETKQKILDNINKKRADLANGKVQDKNGDLPSASNMRKVYWNINLEEKSQNFVNKLVSECKYEHNKDQYIGRYPIGENMNKEAYFKKMTVDNIDQSLEKSVEKWWKERTVYDKSVDEKGYNFDYYTAHFTQLGWAETDEIGCGYALYKAGLTKYEELVVCNFAVEGNDQGREVYTTGEPCGNCGKHFECSKKYPGICSKEKGEDKEIAHHTQKSMKKSLGILN